MFTVDVEGCEKTLRACAQSPRAPIDTGTKNAVAARSPPPLPQQICLLAGHHVERDGRDDVVAEANSRLVRSGRLDRRRDLDLALVDLTEASSGHGVSDIRGLDGAEQAPAFASLDHEGDRSCLQLCLEVLGLFERGVLACYARSLDRLDLLLSTASPRDGEALGNEVVASEAVLDVNDIAGGTETGDLVSEDEFGLCGVP